MSIRSEVMECISCFSDIYFSFSKDARKFVSFFIDSHSAVECDEKMRKWNWWRNQNDFPMTKKYRNEMKKNVNALEFLGAATLLGRTGINVIS